MKDTQAPGAASARKPPPQLVYQWIPAPHGGGGLPPAHAQVAPVPVPQPHPFAEQPRESMVLPSYRSVFCVYGEGAAGHAQSPARPMHGPWAPGRRATHRMPGSPHVP
jgi:hypothetical protein